jgi:hypothetical protein
MLSSRRLSDELPLELVPSVQQTQKTDTANAGRRNKLSSYVLLEVLVQNRTPAGFAERACLPSLSLQSQKRFRKPLPYIRTTITGVLDINPQAFGHSDMTLIGLL